MGLRPYPRQLIGQIVQQLFSLGMALVVFSWKRAEICHFLVESLYTDGSRSECLTYGQTALASPFSDQEAVPAF